MPDTEMLISKLGDCDNQGQTKTRLTGKFYVMDPCYIIPYEPNDMWHECHNYWDWDETGGAGRSWIAIEIRGHQITIFRTSFGDGYFDVTKGGDVVGAFGVDSGSFAFVPKELFSLDDWGRQEHDHREEPLVELDDEFIWNELGFVTVGNLTVDTR